MLYKFQNRTVKIDDGLLQKMQKNLDLSKEEAIQVWLEDEGYLVNEEQESLVQKGTAEMARVKDKSTKGKKKKTSEKKKDLEKEGLISAIADAISELGIIEIINPNNEIKLIVNDDEFKIKISKKRKKK